jgi:hypothetical protein
MRLPATATLLAFVLTIPGFSGVTHAQTGSPTLLILSKFNAVTFPPTTLNITAVQTLTLTNGGTADLVISSLALSGANADDFAIGANGCSSVAPGAVCTITLTFKPSINGDRRARLTIGNNGAGAPHNIEIIGRGIDPSVPQPAVGPIDPRFGFPISYTDHNNVTLELCLDHTPSPVDPLTTLCLSPTPDPALPPSITESLVNFPGEAFWWTGEAAIDDGNIDALIVLAQEAAFASGETPAVNDQAAFGRLRVRMRGNGVVAGAWYRFTHPFGVDEHQADDTPQVFATSDIGCFGFPCDFTASFASKIKNFLTCVSPAPPAGYVGDPAVECTVDGSPLDTNFFRVERIAGPGGTVLQVLGETNLFAVTGKLAGTSTPPPPPPENRPPVANPDTVSTPFGTAVTISVLGNDSDPDGDALIVTSVITAPANGSAANAGSSIVYTPNANFSGSDSFVYEISDGRGGVASAAVTVNVDAQVNLPPVAAPDTATTDAGVAVTIAVLANDSDPDGGTVSVVGASSGSNGSTVLNLGGSVTYTPNAGFSGSDSFSYSIADGQGGTALGVVTVTVNAPPPPPLPADLVLALGFNEATGTAVTDASSEANNGTISGATRSAGRTGFGGALTFDGVNDWVTVADNASLDLSTAMTVEAWVRPTALGAGVWRTILLKEGTGNMAYELYANNDVSRPAAYATFGTTIRGITGTAALALNTWTHVATTYDGANQRFYVNGVLVRTLARTGSIIATAGPLHIGGNEVWGGEWFAGSIDEVRIYRRALSQAEIQADMNTPIQ